MSTLAQVDLVLAMLAGVPTALWFLGAPRKLVIAALVTALAFASALAFGVWWLALPWLSLTVVVAARAARRFAGRGLRDWAECTIDAGGMMLPVGGAWAVAHAAGLEVLGFRGVWVLLTAVHFHYAAFLLPTIVGGFGRLSGRPGPWVAAAIVAGIPLTAIGIAFSDAVESAAAVLLASAALVLAAELLRRRAFIPSGVALGFAMALALSFALQAGPRVPSLDEMILWHGSANALGFALVSIALLAWLRPASRTDVVVPFSRIRGELRLGADFFDRRGLTAEGVATGLVDDLDELGGLDFDPARVRPEIRDFYEHTADYDLHVVPTWKWWSRPAGAIWFALARRIEQTVFPPADGERHDVASQVFRLDAARDGRTLPRAWVRTFPDGRPMYVAAYSTHRRDDRAYMNIAFPFWRSNMASILFPTNLPEGGLRLDTLTSLATPDAGIWQVTPLGPIRLPLREFIDVWIDGETMRARHELQAWRVCYLMLDYTIVRA